MAHKKWIIADADKEKASVLSEKLNIDPLVAYLLVSRGIDSELTACAFLYGEGSFSSPFSLKDMDRAAEKINDAIDENKRICIYGDYDCDGVTATALLYSFLESMGADVMYYIPDRLSEGYGMSIQSIDKISAAGASLIITVDNGISSEVEAEYIYTLGMELIITDHHQPGEKLPRAEAVINPHRDDNDIKFRDYAGVGVAFKLACAVYGGDCSDIAEQYADLVAIGTIGDVVPLRDENRRLVKMGLELINADSRIGIAALRKAAGNSQSPLTAVDAAFQLCPRINAAGRMDSAAKAVELLISEEPEDADFKAQQLNIENAHRHEVEENILDDINEKIKADPSLVSCRVIVIDGIDYHRGVIGIVASHIVSKYGKPAVIISRDSETDECVGSARSVEGFNIFEAFSACSRLLIRYGGHPLAAGLMLDVNDIEEFRQLINDYAADAYEVMPAQVLHIDCKISPFYLDTQFVDNMQCLEPFGASNCQPIFCLGNMTLESVTPIGEDRHIRLEASKKGRSIKAVKFRTTAGELAYKPGDRIDMAVKLSKNLYKGKYYLSIHIVDLRRSGTDDDRYFKEKSYYERFIAGGAAEGALYPDREICSLIYRFLKQNDGVGNADDLYFALNQCVTYGQLCFALKAFEECGLISAGERITLNAFSGKADLQNTEALKALKGRI